MVSIVQYLPLIDMVIRMHRSLGSQFTTHHLNGAIGDHLIDVHVGLSTRPGLPYHQWEMLIQFTINNFISSFDNVICDSSIQTKFFVHNSTRTLQNG